MRSAFTELSRKVRSMVRSGKYIITDHVTKDHPEREIKKDDILEVLKTGEVIEQLPLIIDVKPQFFGTSDRYRWNGKDQRDRILSVLVVVENNVVVVHADFATKEQREAYEKEDQNETLP